MSLPNAQKDYTPLLTQKVHKSQFTVPSVLIRPQGNCLYKHPFAQHAKEIVYSHPLGPTGTNGICERKKHCHGALIVNEIIYSAKRTQNKIFLLKVDFEKSFENLNWSFLFNMLRQMDFGNKWIGWIQGLVFTARVSVLVNGSLTNPFDSMEGLIMTMKGALENALLKGISLPNCLGFRCKSTLTGIKVSDFEVTRMGEYLGLPIGASMSREAQLLSTRKVKCLSMGGRLTLCKSIIVGLGIYFFSVYKSPGKVLCKLERIRKKLFGETKDKKNRIPWVAWNVTINSKENGAEIGRLKAQNVSLLAMSGW
ncbi:hypothetical protein OSB04_001522 [Centaurea solstitialis]|uniref:Reverse transcriptase domain-containing protein n=1 Tax=Centaurea solstitialis TaxID=347529 RepID=A0AA38U1Q4_9ASTR|nr:hypothetical protein OSB04_001522 [Centaurea solstitialis]